MKKVILFIVSIIICLSIITLTSKPIYAEDIPFTVDFGGVWSSITGGGGGATSSVPKGAVNSQQGWLIYVIDGYGNVITPAYACVKGGGYVSARDCNVIELSPRFGGGFSDWRDGYSWPDATVGANFSSNYSAVKSYFVSNKGENLFNALKTYFGDSVKEQFKSEDDYYFVMEPIYWHGLHKKGSGGSSGASMSETQYENAVGASIGAQVQEYARYYRNDKRYKKMSDDYYWGTVVKGWESTLIDQFLSAHPYTSLVSSKGSSGFIWTGDYFCGTEYQGARWIQAQSYDFFIGVDVCRRNYWPNNIKLSKTVAGVPAGGGGGYVGDTNIIHAGYGICAFHNKDLNDFETERTPNHLYETRNWSDTYDISKAIPSSETVNNEIDCSSLTAEEDFFAERKENSKLNSGKEYSTTIKYYWTEEIVHIIPEYWEVNGSYTTAAEANTESSYYNSHGTSAKVVKEDGMYNVYILIEEHEETETIRHDINSRSYTLEGELYYQYIESTPKIFFWDNVEIGNGAFPDGDKEHTIKYTKDNVDKYPEAYSRMKLWNVGNGSCTDRATSLGETDDGVIYRYSKDHYEWMPGNVSYMGDEEVKSVKHYDYETCPYNDAQAETDTNTLERSVMGKYASQIQQKTKSRNDYLDINAPVFGDIVLVDDEWHYGCDVIAKRSGMDIASFSGDSALKYGYKTGGALRGIMTSLKAARVTGEQANAIPDDTDNGDYPTGMHVQYHYLFRPTEIGDEYYAGREYYEGSVSQTYRGPLHMSIQPDIIDDIYNHVIEGGVLSHHVPGDGYPIRVHTPVESPVRITYYDGVLAYEQTQLVPSAYNTSAAHQLLLDKSYFVEWDDTRWFSAIYGDCEGYEDIYNKYVKAKYLKFPMKIVYEGELYETGPDGYTDWILVTKPDDPQQSYRDGVDWEHYESANHWQMTPFYIPTYSEERGAWGDNCWVQCKVEAINVQGRYAGDHSGAQEEIINSDKENYVAIYDTTLQVSGWIYDFTIVGIDNKYIYLGSDNGLFDGDQSKNWLALCQIRQELKSGLKNRIGTDWIRFANDGYVQNGIEERQLIPLRNGYSLAAKQMGDLWRSERFAFTLKTISHLSGANDSVEITPSYRYVTKDGDVLDIRDNDFCYFQMARDLNTGDLTHWYQYNPDDTLEVIENDENLKKGIYTPYSLDDPLFRQSYYDDEDVTTYHMGDWVTRSVDNENTYRPLISQITNQQFMQRETSNYSISHISLTDRVRYISGEYEQLEMNADKMGDEVKPYTFVGHDEDAFNVSMQQWNGEFKIPNHIRLIDLRSRADKDSFNLDDYLDEISPWSWEDYDTFMPFDAYSKMVIHFDIIAYKDGKPYLQYDGSGGGGKNMWDVEGYKPDIGPDPDPGTPDVPIEDGDVVIVDWQRSLGDYWEVGIFNIN